MPRITTNCNRFRPLAPITWLGRIVASARPDRSWSRYRHEHRKMPWRSRMFSPRALSCARRRRAGWRHRGGYGSVIIDGACVKPETRKRTPELADVDNTPKQDRHSPWYAKLLCQRGDSTCPNKLRRRGWINPGRRQRRIGTTVETWGHRYPPPAPDRPARMPRRRVRRS